LDYVEKVKKEFGLWFEKIELFFILTFKHIYITMMLLYIDPGTGSLIFQALLSGLLSILIFYKRIVIFIKSKFNKKDSSELDD
jgi:hypothetical protein